MIVNLLNETGAYAVSAEVVSVTECYVTVRLLGEQYLRFHRDTGRQAGSLTGVENVYRMEIWVAT